MAERVQSINFDWTIMAVKIQREVGGNLAEVLEILANTMRERDRVARQIRVLTAEGKLLIDAGLMSQDELKEALLCQQEQPEKRLGEILISMGMKKDLLDQFIKEQIEDALFEIFDWKEGSYYFETNNVPEEEDIGIYMSVEDIIAEATKRQEEWQKIKEVLPSLDTMVQMSEAPVKSKEDIIIKPEEWKILYLLDKKRSVKDFKG
ncbi:MAG: DUF4388 domain-containing protein [Actinomycetota bacterium]|nr:DUF4388 domain-containing protein [Actinomycetota bacterium]